MARGESTAESDIDLAAVAPAAWEGRHALRDAVKRGFGNACDVLVLDEDRCFSESEPVAAVIRAEGILLYGELPDPAAGGEQRLP